jgi:hypothetical protein
VSDENVPPAITQAELGAAAPRHVEKCLKNVPTKSAWTVPPGYLCGGGAVASLGAATYTGHVPIAVTATVAGLIAILMLLTTLISNVMPQKSEHRKDSIMAVLDHRRKMTALKTKARTEKTNPPPDIMRAVHLDVRVMHTAGMETTPPQPQRKHRRRDPA